MKEILGFRFVWTGRGFGNPLQLSYLVGVLNDNGINAVLSEHRRVRGLVDVPLYDKSDAQGRFSIHTWKINSTYKDKHCCDRPGVLQYLDEIEKRMGRKIEIKDEHDHVPVKYYDIPQIPSVDVVMCTRTGPWAPYREWPYFEELKALFDKVSITYVDLNKEGILSFECLNYVNKCKLYLGLETGTSHYVSQFANGKALILQSGFTPFQFWAYPYHYDYLTYDVPCQPCIINKKDIEEGIVCKRDQECMKKLSVEKVFMEIVKRIR